MQYQTFGTLFAGIGGSSLGAKAAGLRQSFANEWNPAIAAIYHKNVGSVEVCNVIDFRPNDVCDILLASPPCCSFSGANVRGQESHEDVLMSEAVARVAYESSSQVVIIENVAAYFKSVSYQKLVEQLGMPHSHIYKTSASDFIWQNRKRWFAVHSIDSFEPKSLGKSKLPPYPDLEAYADTAKECNFTLAQRNVLGEPQQNGFIQRNGHRKQAIFRAVGMPIPTNRSHQWHDGRGSFRHGSNFIYDGRCFEIPLALLAEVSGFPKDFDFLVTDKASKIAAHVGLGNIVHPQVMTAVLESIG